MTEIYIVLKKNNGTLMILSLARRLRNLAQRADRKTLHKILTSVESRRAIVLYIAQIAGILFAFITQKINTNALSKEQFGAVAWIMQYLIVLHPMFEFGLFVSGSKMLSLVKDREEIRRIYGILIIIMITMCALITVFTFILYIAFPQIFPDSLVYQAMIYGSLFAWVYVVQFFLQVVVQGSSDIHHLSLYTFLSRFLTMASLGLWAWFMTLDHVSSLVLSSLAMALTGVIVIKRINPIFDNWKHLIPDLKRMNKEYGQHIYIGRLVTAPTMQLAPLLVPYFGGVAGSALYAVGSNLVTPMVQATQSISTSLFKNFAQQKKLKDRLIVINFLVLMSIGGGIYLFAPFLIELSANKSYFEALPYMIPLILGGFFQGMWQPFHLFSLARGDGRWIKNQQIVASLFDLVSTLILLPMFGIAGAYWQFFASRCVRFFLTLHNYYRTVKHIESVS